MSHYIFPVGWETKVFKFHAQGRHWSLFVKMKDKPQLSHVEMCFIKKEEYIRETFILFCLILHKTIKSNIILLKVLGPI